ncbi:MAG TPA: FtsX-like permease family protein [Thermoanaerobaculia bacterium]|nr:FtsX-like permease family protein [Thermoanaerobaculia bacterium]
MIARVVSASLRRRFRQLALILAAVTVAAATVAALAGFSARTRDRLGESLAAFGPNLTVRPQVGGPESLPADVVERVREVPGVHTASGVRNTGGVVPASGDGAQKLLRLDRIEVRAEPGKLDEVAQAIESKVEGVEAAPLRRVSESDALLTKRLTLLLAAVSAVSLLLALLSVGAATTALVGERRTEIGLLLALGYTGRRVGTFLAAELLAAAVVAGLLGQLLGELAATSLAHRLLGPGGGVSMTWSGFFAASLAAVLVVGTSMLVALRRVERLDAARVLRGE